MKQKYHGQRQQHQNAYFGSSSLNRTFWYSYLIHVFLFTTLFQVRFGCDDSKLVPIISTWSCTLVESFTVRRPILSQRSRSQVISDTTIVSNKPQHDTKSATGRQNALQIIQQQQTKLWMNNNEYDNSSPIVVFDRFIAKCPASLDSIRLYDPTLLTAADTDNSNADNIVWVAIYRSNNNQPSVLIRDEFFQVMRSATTNAISNSIDGTTYNKFVSSLEINVSNNKGNNSDYSDTPIPGTIQQSSIDKPVAVARLRRQEGSSHNYYYVLDCMRCSLKKESMDPNCDGGSEHTEAICTAIDTLLHHYLVTSNRQQQEEQQQQRQPILEGMIRTKATLIAAPLLEKRGFVEVTEFYNDMTTHISSYDRCYECYAQRSVTSSSSSSSSKSSSPMSPATRQRSIDIVSLLSRIDRSTEFTKAKAASIINESGDDRSNNDDYDPWAGVKKFI